MSKPQNGSRKCVEYRGIHSRVVWIFKLSVLLKKIHEKDKYTVLFAVKTSDSYEPGIHFMEHRQTVYPLVTPQSTGSHLGLFCLLKRNLIEWYSDVALMS